jgi:hypothetical protein
VVRSAFRAASSSEPVLVTAGHLDGIAPSTSQPGGAALIARSRRSRQIHFREKGLKARVGAVGVKQRRVLDVGKLQIALNLLPSRRAEYRYRSRRKLQTPTERAMRAAHW